ncbi:MAG: polysaccharide biosynthesis/export family protein [Polyangiaceae bacterium]|nr:polysaccharide biosynthesis/export family protein [Polyangiaceae bacterium]MBK8938843.1 polysaccharide biosynthesis/export family protein [Polyangiaceae bacterium]
MKARRLFGALAVVTLLGTGCSKYVNYDYTKEFDPRQHEYVLGPADGLSINVWQNGDLSTQAIVRPDGTITMPLVGDLKVSGKTPSAVRDEIKVAISQYVKAEAAIVTVAVTGVNSYRFTVTGNVTNPGSFSSTYYVSIAEALAMAGGPSRFADTSSIEVIRLGRDGKMRRIPVNFDDIETRSRPEANVIVVAGDTIHVP